MRIPGIKWKFKRTHLSIGSLSEISMEIAREIKRKRKTRDRYLPQNTNVDSLTLTEHHHVWALSGVLRIMAVEGDAIIIRTDGLVLSSSYREETIAQGQ